MANYYSGWREHQYECPKCTWTGTGEACATGGMFQDLWEIECPKCGERLDVIQYPTIEEIRANWDKASEADKAQVLAREAFLKQAAATELRDPEQLPEIKGDQIVLVWDKDFGDKHRNQTVIRYGDHEIWREACYYEGIGRFSTVVNLLRKKYGWRLKDVVTTLGSHVDLYGDILSAPWVERDVRWAVWMADPENWLGLEGKYYECSCGWGPDLSTVGRVPISEDGNELKCPNCGCQLDNLQFGELTETVEFTSLVNKCEARMKEIKSENGLAADPSRLKHPDQLIDIEGDDITLVWDCEDDKDSRRTVIRYGEKIIWSEHCQHDCFVRFKSIKDILKKKYGDRPLYIAPTLRTCINLGDRLRDPELELKYELPRSCSWRASKS